MPFSENHRDRSRMAPISGSSIFLIFSCPCSMFTFIFDLAVKNLLEITKTFQNKKYIRSIVNHWHRAIGSRPSVPEIRLENLPPPSTRFSSLVKKNAKLFLLLLRSRREMKDNMSSRVATFASRFAFNAYTLFLFSKSDFKTTIIPVVCNRSLYANGILTVEIVESLCYGRCTFVAQSSSFPCLTMRPVGLASRTPVQLIKPSTRPWRRYTK